MPEGRTFLKASQSEEIVVTRLLEALAIGMTIKRTVFAPSGEGNWEYGIGERLPSFCLYLPLRVSLVFFDSAGLHAKGAHWCQSARLPD